MEDADKDTTKPWTTNQRILHDIRKIQAELELTKMHCIELEGFVMSQIVKDK